MPNDTTPNTVAPLLDKYFTRDISEVVFDAEEADPFVSYLELEGENTAGGHDGTMVVRVVDDGDIIVSPDLDEAGGSIGTYKFEVPLSKLEWKARIRRETLDQTKGAAHGVFDVSKRAIAAATRVAINTLARLAMTKRGALGVIKTKVGQVLTIGGLSEATGSTTNLDITLMNRFKDGMKLVAANALDSGNLRGSTPGDYVTIDAGGINEDTGELTVTGDLTNFAAGDYLWRRGDSYYARATRRVPVGVFEWCDWAAPTASEDFLGVDRSDFPNLQAMRFDASPSGTGLGWKVALMKARSKFINKGRKSPDVVWVPQEAYDEIEAETDAATHITVMLEKDGPGGRKITVGINGIRLTNGRGGTLDVVALPYLEAGLFLMGPSKKSPFKLAWTDKLVRIEQVQGMWRYEEVSDGTEKHVTYTASGSLRGAIYNVCPADWLVGSNYFGPAEA